MGNGTEQNETERLNGDQAAESPPRFNWRHGKTLSCSLSLSLSLTHSDTTGHAPGEGARRQVRGDIRAGPATQVQHQ